MGLESLDRLSGPFSDRRQARTSRYFLPTMSRRTGDVVMKNLTPPFPPRL